jgi:plasmid stabilization system protein ParE
VISVIRPRARDDIIRQYRWYLVEKDAPDAAFRFLDAVEKSVEQLVQTPGMGAPKLLRNSALASLRVWPVEGFEDMRIFYLVQGDSLKVIRTAWQSRRQPHPGGRVGHG